MTRRARKTASARPGTTSRTRALREVTGLDRDRIIDAAWAVVDREGFTGLSTHKVAAELGVKQPALYYHVKNRQHLLSLMTERLLSEASRSPSQDLPWWEWVREFALMQRQYLLSHRDGGLVAASAPPTDQLRSEIFPLVLEPMVRAGISLSDAGALIGSIAGFTLGHVIYEQNEPTRAFMEAYHGNANRAFERGVDFIIAGMQQQTGAKFHE